MHKNMNARTQNEIQKFVDHLDEVANAFNEQSDARSLGVHLDVANLKDSTWNVRNYRNILSFFGSERPGVMYREQIVTAVDAIINIIESPYNLGLILGALQSGKTTTALALQFAGPAVYLVTGQRVFPFYLTTSQNSHEEQLRNELTHFIKYYGDIDVVFHGRRCRLRNYIRGRGIDPTFEIFDMSPNLNTYREVVLQGSAHFHDIYKPATLDDLIHKRVRGQAIRKLAHSCQKMVKAGFTPLMIVDEPQFGASDRLIRVGGNTTVVDCLLSQIEKEIRSKIGADTDRVKAIGLSATPFELHALQRVWTVFQRLGPSYRGFNEFGGQPIDASVQIQPPDTMSMTNAAANFSIPFLPNVKPTAYSRQRSFLTWVRKIGYMGNWQQYRQDCVDAIRDLVLALAQHGQQRGRIPGICLRAMNNNDRTEDLLTSLQLPANQIEVVKFFGVGGQGMTVKQAIAQRTRPHLPYLFLVTSKARMGDQFPSDVHYFIDFSQRASDLNALLQGLVGRACGYDKNSVVILSDYNDQVLDNYVATHGDYVATPSRHSVIAGDRSRFVQRQQLTIERDPNDAILERFFQDLDLQVVLSTVPRGADMKPQRATSRGGRRGPILTIAEQHQLYDYVEALAFQQTNLRHVSGTPKIVRRGETIELKNAQGNSMSGSYLIDSSGACRYNFRKDGYAGRAGIKGRGRGQRDAADPSLNKGILEPSIGLRKRNPDTGDWIDNPDISGEWVAVSITLPLRQPCLVAQTATIGQVSLPGRLCVYDKHMTKRERAQRDGHV